MYVIGYPRSGNTWLCYLLAYCLNLEYDDLDNPGVHPKDEYQRRHVKGGLAHPSYYAQVGKVLKTHSLQINDKENAPVIYLVRDGRDVMVSYYFYINSFAKEQTDVDCSVFPKFVRRYLPDWVRHVRTWIARNPTVIVRYEDLHATPEETLASLMLRLNAEVSPRIIKKAIETFSFTRLSNRSSGEEDIKSFFRKGIVGDWKNYFSDSDSKYFQMTAGDVLEMLGYSNINSDNVLKLNQKSIPSKDKQNADFHKWTPIKVVHLCVQDFGGAGKAAYRLHKGLQAIGVDSTMLVLNKKSGDPSVKVLPNDYSKGMVNCLDVPVYNSPVWNQQVGRWCKLMSEYPNRPAGLEMFTDAISDVRLDLLQEIQDADIINLHWVSGLLDFPSAALAIGNKPIVWTLHDMNPFTGGCHYAGDCKKYIEGCGACPQLGSDIEKDLSNHVWKQKYDAYKSLNINIVTPSQWLSKCACESKLFSRFPVTVIPNGVPIDIFKSYPKAEVRKALNIPESANVILFGADSVVNKRKGFGYLIEAINKFSLKNDRNIIILTFGNLPQGVKITSRYPFFNLGSIADENQLAMIYSAADVFVLPSLEDNLPNTVVEAMASGIPVVGFDIGGIPDMIEHKKTGYLVKPKNIDGLIEGINWIISSYDSDINLSKQCREKVEKEYALEVQAKAYEELYSRILQDHSCWIENIQTKAKNLNQQGEELYTKGDAKGALNAFKKAIEIEPKFAPAHNNLGAFYWSTGRTDKALKHFTEALRFDPFDKCTISNCGIALTSLGKFEDAEKLYSSYLKRNPGDEDISQLLKTLKEK